MQPCLDLKHPACHQLMYYLATRFITLDHHLATLHASFVDNTCTVHL